MRVKLGDIFEIGSGGTPSKSHPEYYGGNIPWVKTGDLKNEYLYEVEDFITEEGLNNSSAKMYEADTVLIAMYGATIGATSILKMNACTNQACAAFKKNEQVIPEYLYYFLRSQKEKFVKDGVGGAQPNISAGYLKKVEMELPSLDEQKVIVDILDKISDLVCKRSFELRSLDDLIKARFVEMFGDTKYPSVPLIDTVKAGAGLSYGIVVPGDNVAEGIPMVRPSDFKNGQLDLSNVYKVAEEIESKYAKTRLIGDEILVQVIGQPGQVMLATTDCKGMNVTRNLAVIRPNHEMINRIYLKEYIEKEDSQQILLNNTKQSTLKQLPLNLLKQLEVEIPPLELQEQFADFVHQVDKSKFKQKDVIICSYL